MKKKMNVSKWLEKYSPEKRAQKWQERKEFWKLFFTHPLGWFILMLLAYPFFA